MFTLCTPGTIPSHPIPCPVQSSRLITGNYIFIQHTMSYFPLCAPSGAQQEESRNGLVSSAKAFSGTRPACGQSVVLVEDKGKNGKREVDQGFFCCMCVVWHSRTGRLVSPDSLATCDSFVECLSPRIYFCATLTNTDETYTTDAGKPTTTVLHIPLIDESLLHKAKPNDRGSDGGASSVRSQINCLSLRRCWLYRIYTHWLVGSSGTG